MKDFSIQIKSALDQVLPTYFELFCDSSTPLPCITYNLYDNYDDIVTAEGGTSYVSYNIKLWGDDLSVLIPKAQEMDTEMRKLGFYRLSSGILTLDDQICLMYVYNGLTIESYNKGE